MKHISTSIKFVMIAIGLWLTAIAFALTAEAAHEIRTIEPPGIWRVDVPSMGEGCNFMDPNIGLARAFLDLVHGRIGEQDMNDIARGFYPDAPPGAIEAVTRTIMTNCGLGRG